MSSRRDFLKHSSAAALAAGYVRLIPGMPTLLDARTGIRGEAAAEDLAVEAISAARDAGASYADARVGRYRRQFVATRERQVTGVADSESLGIGVRALVNGSWGFAATSVMTKDSVAKVAREAVRIARAARSAQRRPVVLAPAPAAKGTWRTPVKIDPINVPIEDKVAMLLAANETALKVPNVRFATSQLALLREEKTLATTDGTVVTQTFVRVGPGFTATAIGEGGFQSYTEELAPRGSGWEYIQALDMPRNAERWGALAAEKLAAKSVEVGRYDLILDPTNLWLTIHESIGHATELDRAMGYEANYAGTSFLAPPEKMLKQFRYGPEFMNVKGDRSQAESLSRVQWDDEGVAPNDFFIIKNGVFTEYQTTRDQVAWIKSLTGVERSHGCSFAQSWGDVQFQRMPNVSLMPGDKEVSLDDIIAATDHGLVVKNRGSWSIDQQRYNFQFSGQVAYEVRGGKITGMVKDFAYQARTPDFWRSMDMIGGPRSYWMGGSFGDGKGEPGQSNSVSHGCPPARFKGVNILNIGRSA